MTDMMHPVVKAKYRSLLEVKIEELLQRLGGRPTNAEADWHIASQICKKVSDDCFNPLERINYIRRMAANLYMDTTSGIFIYNDAMRANGYTIRID